MMLNLFNMLHYTCCIKETAFLLSYKMLIKSDVVDFCRGFLKHFEQYKMLELSNYTTIRVKQLSTNRIFK